LDELENPMNMRSIYSIKKNSNLDDQQIKRSIRRFSEYMNSGAWNIEIQDPVAFLCKHMKSIGEFVPPEIFFEIQKIEKQKERDEEGEFNFEEIIELVEESGPNELGYRLGPDIFSQDCLSSISKSKLPLKPRQATKGEVSEMFSVLLENLPA
jgi:hypothetical protein